MAATMAQRIQDLIGFDYSSNSINTENEAIEGAYAEVIDSLPEEVLLKYAVAPKNLTIGKEEMAIDSKKIIRVMRYDATPIARVCEKLDIYEYTQAVADTNSIYYPTKFSPVYTEDPETTPPRLKVFPAITGEAGAAESAKVWYTSYLNDSDVDGDDSFTGLPPEAENAVALRASIHIMQTKISDTIQDDEDDEMLNMLNNQMQSLQKMYQIEMMRLSGEKGEQ